MSAASRGIYGAKYGFGGSRQRLKRYSVVQALVKNPKTPVPLAMQLVPRLQERDLKLLSRDRGVPEAVRRHAGVTSRKRQGPARG